MPATAARNSDDDKLVQYAVEVTEEVRRRGLSDAVEQRIAERAWLAGFTYGTGETPSEDVIEAARGSAQETSHE